MAPSFERYRNLLLLLALALLLGCVASAGNPLWQRSLFFAHLGAVLLWQPLVSGQRRLSLRETAVVAGIALTASLFLNPWILLLWNALLAAMVAGRVTHFAPRAERLTFLGALVFLILLLFMLVAPDLLPEAMRVQSVPTAARRWIESLLGIALVLLLVLFAVAPARGDVRPFAVLAYDLVYTVWMLALLLLVIFIGVALMTLTQRGYLASMSMTLVGVASALFAFNFLSARSDSAGGGGATISLLVSRYLLSFGLPYELYLDRLAQLSRAQADPAIFFDGAMRALSELAIVSGAQWRGAGVEGSFGELHSRHALTIETAAQSGAPAIELVIHAREALSPVFVWHFKLLLQLAAEFHAAKAREQRLHAQQYLRAVHETGARVTHDVKNLLQSLDGLLAAAATLRDDAKVRALVARQLPVIAQRLATTLGKLQLPATENQRAAPLSVWWERLRRQYEPQSVAFGVFAPPEGPQIPMTLFDSAADNLLQNALGKKAAEPGIEIHVMLKCEAGEVELSVEDTGSRIPTEVMARLFDAPVRSHAGLGIGLYQLSRAALTHGYVLAIAENHHGRVRFTLSGPAMQKSSRKR